MNSKISTLSTYEKTLLVCGKGFWDTYSFEEKGISSIKFSDGPSGLRVQRDGKSDSMGLNVSKPATSFPSHSSLSCSFNENLCYETARRMGEEGAYFGVNVILAPAINIKRNPLCGRNFEYFSEDPYLSGKLGGKFVSGIQFTGIGACVKHFAANNKEFGRTVSDSVIDKRTLREIYLTPFEIAVKTGKPYAVMTAYNRLNGVFCNENPFLIKDVLRGEWGFDGVVLSDWGGTYNRVSAIKAGADLEMPGCKFSVNEVMSAIKDGTLTEDELDFCAENIIRLSEKEVKKQVCDFDEHARFAVKCAAECAVLLKNDGVLPLKENEKIALIGEFAKDAVFQGGGSSRVNPKLSSSLFSTLKHEVYARGYRSNGKKSVNLIKKAVKACKNCDTIVCVLGLKAGDHEGMDRESILLPENQINLLRALKCTGKKVVAVLSCGGAVDTSWDEGVNALLFAGLNGQGGAEAVSDILTGKENPSGKLSETFPFDIKDVASYKYFGGNAYYTLYKEGMNVGYRGYEEGKVKYPFGFGLSYTNFGYSDLKVGQDGVEFTLKNTGNSDGAEAAQMYVSFPENANSSRIQLKGFKKVFLSAGEESKVFIPFDEFTFRSFDVLSDKWKTVSGNYKIFVGSSSDNLILKGEIEKTGDITGVTAVDTSSLTPCEYKLNLNKKGRVIVDLHTPFSELKNSRASLVRLVSRCALAVTRKNPTVGGTLTYAHVRTGAQFSRFDRVRTEGLLDAFNGRYIRGIYKMIKGERRKKRHE